jgi:hypothetical protein
MKKDIIPEVSVGVTGIEYSGLENTSEKIPFVLVINGAEKDVDQNQIGAGVTAYTELEGATETIPFTLVITEAEEDVDRTPVIHSNEIKSNAKVGKLDPDIVSTEPSTREINGNEKSNNETDELLDKPQMEMMPSRPKGESKDGVAVVESLNVVSESITDRSIDKDPRSDN